MKKIIALLLIIFISYSFEERMRCFDDLDGSPTEKCYVYDRFNDLHYYDSCKNGKICTETEGVSIPSDGNFYIDNGNGANYGVCAPVPFGGFEGSVCGDNAECFSNNCDGTKCGEPAEFCKRHSECEKGKYCNNTETPYYKTVVVSGNSVTTTEYISPDNKCTDLQDSDEPCYDDYMCPPLHLCHHITTDIVGKCKKIGSVTTDPLKPSDNKLLCKSGYKYNNGTYDYCVNKVTSDCKDSSSGTANIYFYNSGINSKTDSIYCRRSLLDNSRIPVVDENSITAFEDYADEINGEEVKKDKKHANYGYIRYHYDKKKLKEKLIKAMYPELTTKDDDTAECLLDVVKQLQLSGEKIKFSSLLVFAFAVLLL